jgi:hypothetical protein
MRGTARVVVISVLIYTSADVDTGERRYKEAKRMHEQRKGRTP